MANYKIRLAGGSTRVVQKTSLVKTSDTTLAGTELKITCVAGKSYEVNGFVVCDSSATPDSKFGISNDTCVFLYSGWDIDTQANVANADVTLASESGNLAGLTNRPLYVRLHLVQCTTGGLLRLTFAQNTSNGSASTFRKGSYWNIIEFEY